MIFVLRITIHLSSASSAIKGDKLSINYMMNCVGVGVRREFV